MRKRDVFEVEGMAGQPIDHCVVISAHGHLGENHAFPVPDTSLKTMLATMDALGIDVLCCSGYAGVWGMARRGNDIVIDAVSRFPDRIFGYMCPQIGYREQILPELERCLAAGLRAIKIHNLGTGDGPGELSYDNPNYELVFDFAERNGLPILAHTFGRICGLAQLEPWFPRYPEVRFVLAHSGGLDRDEYLRLAAENANVYLETCLSACPRGLMEYFVGGGLADKLLWGTDANFMSSSQQLGRVLFAKIAEEDKRKILGSNAARVLGICVPSCD